MKICVILEWEKLICIVFATNMALELIINWLCKFIS